MQARSLQFQSLQNIVDLRMHYTIRHMRTIAIYIRLWLLFDYQVSNNLNLSIQSICSFLSGACGASSVPARLP